MKRKYSWVPPVVVAATLVTYFYLWPWYRDRPARAAADALIAELDEHAGEFEQQATALPEVPVRPTKADLEGQLSKVTAEMGVATGRTRELARRAEDLLPKAPPDKRAEVRQALERYSARVGQALDKFKTQGELLRGRLEVHQAGAKPATK